MTMDIVLDSNIEYMNNHPEISAENAFIMGKYAGLYVKYKELKMHKNLELLPEKERDEFLLLEKQVNDITFIDFTTLRMQSSL